MKPSDNNARLFAKNPPIISTSMKRLMIMKENMSTFYYLYERVRVHENDDVDDYDLSLEIPPSLGCLAW